MILFSTPKKCLQHISSGYGASSREIAVQHVQMSELHERLAAQEFLTNNLLNKISKLGCKLGNTEATFKQDLEAQNTKLSV